MKRSDYRRQYIGLNLEELKNQLPKLQDKYLENIGICEDNYKHYYKRYCYVKEKIKKLEEHEKN